MATSPQDNAVIGSGQFVKLAKSPLNPRVYRDASDKPDEICLGVHRFFVATVVGVPAEGAAHVLIVCTACGEARNKSFQVSRPTTEFLFSKQKEEKE